MVILWPLAALNAAADESRQLTPEAFVDKFNMRTVLSSYGQSLKYYCEQFPKQFFSKIHYASNTKLHLYNGTDYWWVEFHANNKITLGNQITDASYRSQSTHKLAYSESEDEWRAEEAWIERPTNCEPFVLEEQLTFGGSHYSFEEITTYVGNHDPGYVELGNGQEVTVDFDPIPWEEVDDWQVGKLVSLIYEPATQIRLKDLDSQTSVPVYFYSGDHPIDRLESACIDVAGDTISYAECYSQSRKAWDMELNSNYLMLLKMLDDEEKSKVRAAQRQWIKFRDAQIEAVSTIAQRPGTIWTIRAANLNSGLTKAQAMRLRSLIP